MNMVLGAQTKVVSFTDYIVRGVPLLEMHLLNAKTKVSVDKSFNCSKYIARTVDRQICIFLVCLFVLKSTGRA